MVKPMRYIDCWSCKETTRAFFPTGYRGAGIESCPECGSRNIDIILE